MCDAETRERVLKELSVSCLNANARHGDGTRLALLDVMTERALTLWKPQEAVKG